MQIQSELLYTDNQKVIVKVCGTHDSQALGSALGQGETVEEAEDNAIKRLKNRLVESQERIKALPIKEYISKEKQVIENANSTFDETKVKSSSNGEVNKVELPETMPEDWSSELYEYEKEISRLDLGKEDENKFIQEITGCSNRTMITNFNDLIFLIKVLKIIGNYNNVKDIKDLLNRDNLIKINSQILKELDWDTDRARKYMFNKYKIKSRAELSNRQLIEFNLTLTDKLAKE